MKSVLLLSTILLTANFIYSQGQQEVPENKPTDKEKAEAKINKKVIFGVSLGFLSVFDQVYEARISPISKQVMIGNLGRSAYMLSTGVAIPVGMGRLGGSYYRKIDADGEPYGDLYYVPSGLHFVASVNLVTFNSATSGSIFNKRLDGGLGLGYRASEDFLISLTYEMISYRQPRDFLINDYKDKTIEVDGTTLNALSEDSNDYFRDKYMSGLSLKFVYLFGADRITQ